MNLRYVLLIALVAACGKDSSPSKTESGGGGGGGGGGAASEGASPKDTWLKATWKKTDVDLDGVKLTVEVPDGLPANADYMLGKDWWVGANASDEDKLDFSKMAGPRLTLDKARDKTFADAEALARDVEPDAARADLVEIAKEQLPDGRLRYVSAVKGGSHLDVTYWIPLDATRGIRCNAHWWTGPGEHANAAPDPAITEWLGRFCASVTLLQ
jgi:hypothetical protein